jgi:hypothetical protein
MKTRFFLLSLALASVTLSCTDKLSEQLMWGEGVMATIPGYEDADGTRVSFVNGLGNFRWSNGDCIGVCRSSSSSNGTAAFTLLKGGESVGNFINDSFSLLTNTDYYAFYPFTTGVTASSYPVNMANQVQNGNNDLSHIGQTNYMATKFTTDDNGKASFTFSNIGAVIQVHFTAEKEDTYKSMSITSNGTPFTIRAKYNLASETVAEPYTNEMVRVLFGDEGMHVYNGESVTVSMLVFPDDLSQSTLTFSVKNANGVAKEFSLSGFAFSKGKIYHFYEDDSKGNPPYGGCPDGNHPHAIDLGLPSGTLWSCMDLGAVTPISGGIAFSWGETDFVEKNNATWSNYKFMTDSYDNQWGISKYQVADGQKDGVWYNEAGEFIGDNKRTLEMIDDAARQNWGAPWRIPTKEEVDELNNYTNLSRTENYNGTGQYGYILSKKKTHGAYTLRDPHILFRGSQYKLNIYWYNGSGLYWTSTLQQVTQKAYLFDFGYRESGFTRDPSRYTKKYIRPVQSKN